LFIVYIEWFVIRAEAKVKAIYENIMFCNVAINKLSAGKKENDV
jgi:hypothetical protein